MMKDSDLYGQSLYDLASSENLADDILCQMQTVRSFSPKIQIMCVF